MPLSQQTVGEKQKNRQGRRQQDMLVDAIVRPLTTHIAEKQTSRQGPKNAFVAAVMPPILEEYRWQLRIETVPQSLASCRTVYNKILSIRRDISEDSNHPCSIDNSNNYRHMDIRAMPTKTEATAQQCPAYSKGNGIISCNFWNAIYPTNTRKHAFKHIS